MRRPSVVSRGEDTSSAVADQTEEAAETLADESADAALNASASGPAPDTSLPSGVGSGTTSASGGRRRGSLPAALLIVGLALAVVGSWFWWDAAHDEQLAAAKDRDAVLTEATAAITTLNTFGYQTADDDLSSWADVTTGTMHDGIVDLDDTARQSLVDMKKTSTAKVLDSAVLSMDGTEATVLAAVEITVVDDAAPDSEPTLKRNRFSANMKFDAESGRWKVENLAQVAVTLS